MKPGKILNDERHIIKSWNNTEYSIKKMGFDYCIYPHINLSQKIMGVIITPNAIDWRNYHLKNGYIQHDLVRKTALRKKILVWNSVNETDKNIKKIFNDRRDYGMKYGITVPIVNKFGNLAAWLSLAAQNSEKEFSIIISDPLFSEKVYDIHIKTVAYALSDITGIAFNICYAIALSQYTYDIATISHKTGLLAEDLYKLFGNLYLYRNNIDFSRLNIQKNTVDTAKYLVNSLKGDACLNYKFSNRQLDCIQLIKKGLTVKAAAKELGISPRTYEGYAKDIRQKLHCSTQKELMFKLSNYNIL